MTSFLNPRLVLLGNMLSMNKGRGKGTECLGSLQYNACVYLVISDVLVRAAR